ncbi:MAG: TRAP transporter small permease subunit [Betaproteobacteria bacterium]
MARNAKEPCAEPAGTPEYASIQSPLDRIERWIDTAGRLSQWTALGMIALVAVNVILRYSLSLGAVWAQELEWHLLAMLTLLGLAHALQRGDEVRVDVYYARYSVRTRAIVDLVSLFLLFLVASLLVRLSIPYVMQSFSIAEISPDPGGLPMRWLIKAMIPLGFALVALHCIAAFFRTLLAARDVLAGKVAA